MDDSVAKYLKRIGYNGDTRPTAEVLGELQELHYYSVPYENIDIIMGKPLSMNNADIYRKVVDERRGGYCFELNGLYGWLLRELGYEVKDYTARFLLGEKEVPMRRHRVLVAQAGGTEWLCDVGVGIEVPRRAVRLEAGLAQEIGGTVYRMEKEDFFGWVLWENHGSEWRRIYSFTLEEQLPIDFVMPSFYCEKHPDSIFNKQYMVSLKTREGRKTLDGRTFKKFTREGVEEYTAADEGEVRAMMQEWFGVTCR